MAENPNAIEKFEDRRIATYIRFFAKTHFSALSDAQIELCLTAICLILRTDFPSRYEECFALDLSREGYSFKQFNLRDNPTLLYLNLQTCQNAVTSRFVGEFMQHLKALARPVLQLFQKGDMVSAYTNPTEETVQEFRDA